MGKWLTATVVIYLTSKGGRIELRRGSKSSTSGFVLSKAVEKRSFSIATAVPMVIMNITKPEIISTGWVLNSLLILFCVFSGIKLPCQIDTVNVVLGDSWRQSTPPAFPLRVLYCFQPHFIGIRLPDTFYSLINSSLCVPVN